MLGGTGYLTVHRQVAADGPSAGGWGRWCGPADGRPNGGHPDPLLVVSLRVLVNKDTLAADREWASMVSRVR